MYLDHYQFIFTFTFLYKYGKKCSVCLNISSSTLFINTPIAAVSRVDWLFKLKYNIYAM